MVVRQRVVFFYIHLLWQEWWVMEHADHTNALFGDGGRRKKNESTVLDSCQWNLSARDRWSYINQIIQIPDFHFAVSVHI